MHTWTWAVGPGYYIERDKSVSAAQSLLLAQQLQRLGRVYELVVYAEDNHDLTRNQEDIERAP